MRKNWRSTVNGRRSGTALSVALACALGGGVVSPPPASAEPVAAAGPTVVLAPLDGGTERIGTLDRIAGGVWHLGGGAGAIDARKVLSAYFSNPPQPPSTHPEVTLANGDILRGSVQGIGKRPGKKGAGKAGAEGEADTVVFGLVGGGSVEVELERIRSIVWWAQLSQLTPDRQAFVLERVSAENPDIQRDLVAVDLGNGIADLDGSEYLKPEILKEGGVRRRLPDPEDEMKVVDILARLVAVRIKFPLSTEAVPPEGGGGSIARVWTTDGSRLTGQIRGFDGGKLSLTTAHGFPIEIAAGLIRQIDYLLPPSQVRFLSDLGDPEVTARRFLDEREVADRLWPHFVKDRPAAPGQAGKLPLSLRGRVYAKGIGTHSYARVVYPLPEGAIRFIAEVGIDDHVAESFAPESAGVIVRVFADGKLLHESPFLTIGSPVERIAVEVAGYKRLAIETDWGDRKVLDTMEQAAKGEAVDPAKFLPHTDVLDRVTWGHAVVVLPGSGVRD